MGRNESLPRGDELSEAWTGAAVSWAEGVAGAVRTRMWA